MKCIHLQPYECWDYAKEHEEELMGEEQEIASEEEFGVQICIHVQDNLPVFDVYVDDEIKYTTFVFSEEDCCDVVADLYNDYLDDFLSTMTIKEIEEDEEEIALQEENAIEDQDTAIECVVEDFLDTVCEGIVSTLFSAEDIEKIKDHFCEYIARNFTKQVYRPMYLFNANGDKIYADYPYEIMEFDEPICS